MTTLRNLPPIRALAEERARELWAANVRQFQLNEWAVIEDPADAGDGFDITVESYLDLLCDTSRQASRDDLAGLIGKAIDWHRADVTGAIECCADYVRFRRLMADRYGVELPQDWQQVDAADALPAIALAVLA